MNSKPPIHAQGITNGNYMHHPVYVQRVFWKIYNMFCHSIFTHQPWPDYVVWYATNLKLGRTCVNVSCYISSTTVTTESRCTLVNRCELSNATHVCYKSRCQWRLSFTVSQLLCLPWKYIHVWRLVVSKFNMWTLTGLFLLYFLHTGLKLCQLCSQPLYSEVVHRKLAW